MKNFIKKASLVLVFVLVLAISFGCTPKESPVDPNTPGDVVDKEDPVTPDPDNETESLVIIATDKMDVSNLTLLDSYIMDFDRDRTDETISLYTAAGKDPEGNIAWDDGQNWKLIVHDEDKDYVLFDDYVQLGNIKFYVYTSDDDFYITTIQTGTASLKATEYKFDKEADSFISTVVFETTGNVNLLHSSYGY